MRVELEIWRQDGPWVWGSFKSHVVKDVKPQMGLLELLDRLSDRIIKDGGEPVIFESDCREGVCGICGFLVNGAPHGLLGTTPACRQHLRAFLGIMRSRLEPRRPAAFPVVRNLVMDRTTLDELIWVGRVVDVAADTTPDADDVAQGCLQAERALDFTACISCRACMAAYPGGAATLFVGAELAHLSLISQGRIERGRRTRVMTREFDVLFGPCSEFGEYLPACPMRIPIETIALFSREVLRADLHRATHDDQGPLHKQGRIHEFVPQVVRSRP